MESGFQEWQKGVEKAERLIDFLRKENKNNDVCVEVLIAG